MKKKPPLDLHTRIGILAILFFIRLVGLGGVKNVLSYSNSDNELIGPSFFISVESGEGIREAGEEKRAVIEEETPPGETDFEGYIQTYSEQYQVSASLVRCIIWKESTNNPNAVGSAGEQGLAQFKLSTWRSFRKQMGESQEVSPFNPEEAIKTLCFALSKGWGYHWSTFKL